MTQLPDDQNEFNRKLIEEFRAAGRALPGRLAQPAVTVEVDGEEYAATARPAPDRDALFARIAEQYPFFTDHQSGVDRVIPVVELTRAP
jgi:hypothetical protein